MNESSWANTNEMVEAEVEGGKRNLHWSVIEERRRWGEKESEECPEACWYTEAGEEPVYTSVGIAPCPVFVGWTSTRQRGQEEDQLPWWNINLAETRLSRMSRWMKLSWASIPIPLNGKEKLLAEQIVLLFLSLTSANFQKKEKGNIPG